MATQVPDWTLSPAEWAVLRDQLITSSKPSLSSPTKLSSYVLIGLCSTSAILHLFSLWLRLRRASSRFSFGSACLGYHQPNLPLILPICFFASAILNIFSISSLLSDANRSVFKGHTLAIQHFNYSFLLSAGVVTTWALACGLPPLHIGLWKPARNRGRQPHDEMPSRSTIPPWRVNMIGYMSIVLVFIIPLPCIILAAKATDRINELDGKLLEMVEQMMANTGQPAQKSVEQALQTINSLDQASAFLFLHLRMLAAIHLIFTFILLLVALSVSLAILRPLVRHPDLHEKPWKQLHRFPRRFWQSHRSGPDHLTKLGHVHEPKPAVVADSTRTLDPSSPARKLPAHVPAYEVSSNAFAGPAPQITYSPSFASEAGFLPGPVHLDRPRKLQHYVKQIKLILAVVVMVCLSFLVWNVCIAANLFKYPDEISIGDLSILKLEWSTWLWNGSLSPVVGSITCFMLWKSRQPFPSV